MEGGWERGRIHTVVSASPEQTATTEMIAFIALVVFAAGLVVLVYWIEDRWGSG